LLGSTSAETSDIAHSGARPEQPKIGGCFTGEDPGLDARSSQPRWADVASVGLVPAPSVGDTSARFSLWRIPGRKQLFHAGLELQLWSRTDAFAARLRLALGLEDSEAFAYVIPADGMATARLLAVREALGNYHSMRKALRVSSSMTRCSRIDLFHMRALQAFDATAAGASHREIADVLFGSDVACGWSSDSDVRAQVRHLIKRARHYVNRGYLALLGASDARERRSQG
jgi:hypothetical protein